LDPFGEELRAAVHSRIDAKHTENHLAGDARRWLVIVLGDTNAYWQFIHPPENTPGPLDNAQPHRLCGP